jgi:hypothetical protein
MPALVIHPRLLEEAPFDLWKLLFPGPTAVCARCGVEFEYACPRRQCYKCDPWGETRL